MSDLARLYRASAHSLPMVETGSVQSVITSPPYFGLRKYDGEQDIGWPAVTYAPIAGMAAITVQGCEADCEHEWGEPIPAKGGAGNSPDKPSGFQQKSRAGQTGALSQMIGSKATQGAYCQKCGGWRGPLGNEPTLEAYIAHLILCAREWRRCLHDTGTLFVNLGDSYAGANYRGGGVDTASSLQRNNRGSTAFMGQKAPALPEGIRAKNLLMVPARFALAMQADGWVLRSELVWAKPNPMPESVTDRPTKAHEMIYLFSKQERYFWDQDAVREPQSANSHGGTLNKEAENGAERKVRQTQTGGKFSSTLGGTASEYGGGRNMRTVLTVATQPYAAAHFATFPPALVEPMIRAGTSERGCCPTCGKCWRRVVERERIGESVSNPEKLDHLAKNGAIKGGTTGRRLGPNVEDVTRTIGWEASCDCPAHEPVPCVVMDPFGGSQTTGKEAIKLGRRYIGIDLCEEYLTDLAPERLTVQMEMI